MVQMVAFRNKRPLLNSATSIGVNKYTEKHVVFTTPVTFIGANDIFTYSMTFLGPRVGKKTPRN